MSKSLRKVLIYEKLKDADNQFLSETKSERLKTDLFPLYDTLHITN